MPRLQPRGPWFAHDSPLEEAVMSEPVSESARFPGNWEQYRETRRTQRTSIPNQRRYQWLSSRIPWQKNRQSRKG